jgi:putative aldouronate transport system substrate-binding protein
MKNVKKQVLMALAIIVVAGSIAGCKKNEEKANTPAATGPVPVKIFANFSPADQSNADKAFTEAVEKATNTKITYEIPPSGNYSERLNVMLASGDYADVIMFDGGTTSKPYVDAVNNGIVIPITKYVEKSPNLKKYSYDISWDSFKMKGDNEIYALPRTTIQRADGFLVRQDWMDAVGFKVPSDNLITIDQFTELLTKFTKNDPDQNGKADTYGWTSSQGGDGSIGLILDYPFGLRGWQKTNGEKYEYMDPGYSKENPAYKKALEYSAKLFKDGVIDPNFTSIKLDAAKARFKQGVNGAMGEFAGWIPEYQNDAAKINPKAKMTYISGIKDADGKFQRPSFGTGTWGCWGVTSAAKNPEAVVKIFDYLLSDEGWPLAKYGVEGSTYKKEGTKLVATDEFSKLTWGPAIVRRNNDPEFFVKINMQEEYKEPVKKWIDTAIKASTVSLDLGFRPAAADKPEYIDYQKQLAQVRAKIITGAAPVSDWDKALDGWYKAGGEEYVKQMNEYIKKTQTKK